MVFRAHVGFVTGFWQLRLTLRRLVARRSVSVVRPMRNTTARRFWCRYRPPSIERSGATALTLFDFTSRYRSNSHVNALEWIRAQL